MNTQVMSKPIEVLLVEHNPRDIRYLKNSLIETSVDGFNLTCAGRLTDAIRYLEKGEYGIVLMDLSLPDSEGFNTFISLRMHSPEVPIILLTGLNDEDLAVRVLQNGAQDYLIKGQVDGRLLSRSIRFAIERHQVMQKENRLAYYDALTGLPNRQLFRDRLSQALTHAQRYDKMVSLMFIDLDGFKVINDTMGHDMGDCLLQAVARRLECCLRKSDTIARIGGDEFTCILPHIENAGDVHIVAGKIIRALSAPFDLKGRQVCISGSVGASLFPEDTEDIDELIKNADVAMYSAKKHGKNDYRIFSGSDNELKKFAPSIFSRIPFMQGAQKRPGQLKRLAHVK